MTAREIKELREQMLEVNQTEFAHLLRVSVVTVNRWERGKAEPEKEMVEQLKALKELLDRKDADKGKILDTIRTVGLASAVTWAATAGLITSRAIAFALSPLAGIAGAAVGFGVLGRLFVHDLKKKKTKRKEVKK